MKALLYIFIFLMQLWSSNLFAQTKIQKVNTTAYEYLDDANKKAITDPISSFDLATKALDKSFATKDKLAEASSYNTLGTLYYNSKDYTKAIEYFNKAKAIYETNSDPTNQEYTLKYLAKSYEQIGQADKTVAYYEQAENSSTNQQNKNSYRIENSKVKRKIGKTDEAIKDLENELATNATLSQEDKIDIYLELGDLYIEEKDTAKGIELIDEALSSSQADVDGLSWSTYNSASDIYEKSGLTEQNIQTQVEAIDIAKKNNSVLLDNAANFNIGNSLIQSDPDKAILHLQKSADITQDNNDLKKDHIKAVEKLSQAYEKSGEYDKALVMYKKYILLVDSIKQSEIESKLKAELISTKYQVQESKIKELETKQLEKEESLRIQQNTIWSLIAGLILFGILIYFLIRNSRQKQRSNTIIRLASLRSQMNPHFIFNSLNSVNGFISNNEERKANRYITDFSKLMRSVLKQSNQESIPLSEEIESLNIYLALEHSRFEDQFSYTIDVDEKLQQENVEIPPMLVQPYIENSIWHGLRYKKESGDLAVKFLSENGHLAIHVIDNGIGRKKSQELKTKHQRDYKSTGIQNTKERVALLNQLHNTSISVEIDDLENKGATGTHVTLKIPIQEKIEWQTN